MSKREITVEQAGVSREHIADVMAMLIMLHGECGLAPLEYDLVAKGCLEAIEEGHVFIARIGDQAVGILALHESPFWYSRVTCLWGIWFYVLPEFRGVAGLRLLFAARQRGQEKNKIVFVSSSNPSRRAKHRVLALESQMSCFVPMGYTLRLR
jgi:hypothetical protein